MRRAYENPDFSVIPDGRADIEKLFESVGAMNNQKKIQALIFRLSDLSSKRKACLDQLWVLEHEAEELRQEQVHLIDECLREKQ